MLLPFLKESKRPRVARPGEGKLPEEKLINGSYGDNLDAYCAGELMDAYAEKDPKKFRSALSALIMNMFENEEPNAADAR